MNTMEAILTKQYYKIQPIFKSKVLSLKTVLILLENTQQGELSQRQVGVREAAPPEASLFPAGWTGWRTEKAVTISPHESMF